MSFGYSIGDFIAGANLSYQLIKALSATKGCSDEYQEALLELGCLQQTFLQVGRMTTNPGLHIATINAASHIVLSSMGLIGDFLERTKKYRARLSGSAQGNAMSDSWQKMGWVLFKKEELKSLTNELHLKLSNISLLLSTAKFNERMPSAVAQYQNGPRDDLAPPPSYTHSSEDFSDVVRSSVESLDSAPVSEPTVYSSLDGNNSSEMDRSSETDIRKHVDLERRGASLEGNMAQESTQQPATRSERTPRPSIKSLPAKGQVKTPRPKKAASISNGMHESSGDHLPTEIKEDVGLFTRCEQFLKAEKKKEVHDPAMVADLQSIIMKHGSGMRPAPIKFKDAVGRKFSFPFDQVTSWTGMEELIKQAFLHVDVIGPHVADGHYDLISPAGEIILPQVWETMIKPDMAITMHMWPMPEPKPSPPPGFFTGSGRSPPPPPPPPPPRPRGEWPPSPFIDVSSRKTKSKSPQGILNWMTGGKSKPAKVKTKPSVFKRMSRKATTVINKGKSNSDNDSLSSGSSGSSLSLAQDSRAEGDCHRVGCHEKVVDVRTF